jgi:DNA-binding response OmpR family regulator
MMGTSPSPMVSALVVDPDPASRQTLTACLSRQYRILVAGHLAEALECLARERPHVMVLEVNQPDGDGIHLIERLRTDAAMRGMIIVCVTNRRGVRDKVRGFQAGADDYVIKPVDPGTFPSRLALLARLRRLSS